MSGGRTTPRFDVVATTRRSWSRAQKKAIVAEIRRRFDAVPKWDGMDVVPSIGVVTFNAQQRSYIESLLRDADDDRLAQALDRTDGEGLFVKNLENVQGDERDVVFFSTGFSPNASGELPLNFGPLNREGGERKERGEQAPRRWRAGGSSPSGCRWPCPLKMATPCPIWGRMRSRSR